MVLKETKWLSDAKVKSKVEFRKGRWYVLLIFIDTKNSSQLLVQEINDYRSQRLAEIGAVYIQKTVAKEI